MLAVCGAVTGTGKVVDGIPTCVAAVDAATVAESDAGDTVSLAKSCDKLACIFAGTSN
jgi:hypothetical protein